MDNQEKQKPTPVSVPAAAAVPVGATSGNFETSLQRLEAVVAQL